MMTEAEIKALAAQLGISPETAAQIVGGGGGQQPAQGGAKVFWGSMQPIKTGAALGVPQDSRRYVSERTMSADQVIGYMAQLRLEKPGEYAEYVKKFQKQGVIGAEFSTDDVDKAWARAVGLSADLYAGGTYLAPWDAIALMSDNTAAGRAGAQTPFTGTKTQSVNRTSTESSTNRRVNLSSASEARAFLLQAAERELGRAATADEIAAFRAALNSEEKANAEVSKTKGTTRTTGSSSTTYKDGDATASSDNTNTSSTSNTTETGGMDRGQYALDYARSAGDYAEYQAATTYMNTLFAALQSPVDVGTN